MLGLKLNHVSKRGHRATIMVPYWACQVNVAPFKIRYKEIKLAAQTGLNYKLQPGYSKYFSPGRLDLSDVFDCFLEQNSSFRQKNKIPWPKSNQFWRWPEYLCMPDFRPFLACIVNQNLISCGADQDTATYQISYHFLLALGGGITSVYVAVVAVIMTNDATSMSRFLNLMVTFRNVLN